MGGGGNPYRNQDRDAERALESELSTLGVEMNVEVEYTRTTKALLLVHCCFVCCLLLLLLLLLQYSVFFAFLRGRCLFVCPFLFNF